MDDDFEFDQIGDLVDALEKLRAKEDELIGPLNEKLKAEREARRIVGRELLIAMAKCLRKDPEWAGPVTAAPSGKLQACLPPHVKAPG